MKTGLYFQDPKYQVRLGGKSDYIRDPSLVLDLPLYTLDGASFMSKDAYGHRCTNLGSIWTPQGRSFDGVDDYVDLDASIVFDFKAVSAKPFTLSVWSFQKSYPIDSQTFAAIGTTHFNAISFNWDLNGNLFIIADTSGTFSWDILSRSVSSVSLNTWSFATFTRDTSGNYIFYIDGTDAGGRFTDTRNLFIDINRLRIAGHYALAQGHMFNGLIGELCIYNRALTPQEIQHNYLATKWRYR
jgi:hypothetical protein